jgi:hypothetical protein
MTRSLRASDVLTKIEVALLTGRNLGQIESEINESSVRDDKPTSNASPDPAGGPRTSRTYISVAERD